MDPHYLLKTCTVLTYDLDFEKIDGSSNNMR